MATNTAHRVAIYIRVSTDKQTSENQFDDLLREGSARDTARDWSRIRRLLSNCISEECRPGSNGNTGEIVYKVRPEIVEEVAKDRIYVEQGRSSRSGAKRRPLFERMKRDAAMHRYLSTGRFA